MKNIVILGATGSIGTQTLSVMAHHPDRFQAYALVGHQNVALMLELCQQHRPNQVIMTDEAAAQALQQQLRAVNINIEVGAGHAAVLSLMADPKVDAVMCAMVGAVGIAPTYHAILHHKDIYLANKEAMVVAGALITRALRHSRSRLLPIDSEHNALFQCLPAVPPHESLTQHGVHKLWLTASGGPFLGKKREDLHDITPAEACAHPKWKMGAKISVDSATLMNKGLEVIEAHFLFHLPPEQIEVVIHPQSLVHSMVEYIDGSFLAQISTPDMRTPIAHALGYPERIAAPVQVLQPLNPLQFAKMEFSAPDRQAFPCLDLAFQALRAGGTAPLVLNAANEIAVAAFLNGQCRFTEIAKINADMLAAHTQSQDLPDVASVIAEDLRIRALTEERLGSK